jgi:hypothetical protein
MQKWAKDGIVAYSLLISILLGAPGGILVGRKHEGWAWPVAGGILSTLAIGLLLFIFGIF